MQTPGYMTLTLGPRKNPRRKVAFLLEKTVGHLHYVQIWARFSYGQIPPGMCTSPLVIPSHLVDGHKNDPRCLILCDSFSENVIRGDCP